MTHTNQTSATVGEDREAAAQLACATFYGNDWQWDALNDAFREKWREVVDAATLHTPPPVATATVVDAGLLREARAHVKHSLVAHGDPKTKDLLDRLNDALVPTPTPPAGDK